MEMTGTVMETMYDKLDKFLKTETVIGEPMVFGKVKVIPIVTASFGLGGGLGEDSKKGGKSEGGGGGLGCRISPTALLVIKNDNEVELIQINAKRSLNKLIDMAPELISKVENFKHSSKDDKESEENDH
ncbi:MAG: GerW family sporulation protein [Bacillota bacterium]